MHNMTGRCHAGIIADGHLVSARVPVGSHYTVDTFCLGHSMVVSCMTADSERAGLDNETRGMRVMSVEVRRSLIHFVEM